MKKWFSIAGGISTLAGSILFGLSITEFGIIQVLTMIFLLIGGFFMGLNSVDLHPGKEE